MKGQIDKLLTINGKKTVDQFHKELGKIMWDYCGMSRTADGLKTAKKMVAELRAQYWQDLKTIGTNDELNITLEKAYRVADFMELGELMIDDALNREESCGGHFREEYQTEGGEALRVKEYQYVSAWEYKGEPKDAVLHKEDLVYENIEVKERSYK